MRKLQTDRPSVRILQSLRCNSAETASERRSGRPAHVHSIRLSPKTGTGDAIAATRRHLELAWAQRNGHVSMLALDWRKAFDCINTSALIIALRRFGVPEGVLEVIQSIYTDRRFRVPSSQGDSTWKSQAAGISQGCPLSPFLFVMLMTVLLRDAVGTLSQQDQRSYAEGELSALLYADDTLLVGGSAPGLQRLVEAVARTGAKFGLQLHADKFQLIQARHTDTIFDHEGAPVTPKHNMLYLGTAMAADGTVAKELGHRIGAASAAFNSLAQLWRHTGVTRQRKTEIFQAVVTSRLLYGLSSAWLNVAEQRRLDGFQARCLRRIWGIQPSYLSRVSNKEVLRTSGQLPYRRQLMKQQLTLFGKVARARDDDPVRRLTFCPGSLRPTTSRYVRRRGRPRHEWATKLWEHGVKLAGDAGKLPGILADKKVWEHAVATYCG